MSIQRWFYLNLSRKDAEHLLLTEGIKGSYLVRESQNNVGNFTLSVRRDSDVVHIKISNHGDYFDIATGSEFASLSELIFYYSNEGNKLYETNGNLVEPKFPLLCLLNNNESFIPGLNQKKAEELLLNDGRQYSYLIRESLSNRGDFVLCVLIDRKVVSTIIEHQKEGKYKIKGLDVKTGFDSFANLITYYKNNQIIIKGDIHFKLGEAVKFVTSSTNTYANVEVTDPILLEFETLQNDVSHMAISRAIGQFPENRDRNRYKNIVPYDVSRVILDDMKLDANKNNYINASYISIPNSVVKFIATQGCLSTTCIDFWRMIWQENSNIIVMITKCIEHGKNKCVNYWPTNEEPILTYNLTSGLLTVKLEDTKACQDKSYILRKFVLCLDTLKDSKFGVTQEKREIYQYHFVIWPDKSVPDNPKPLVVFLLKIQQHQNNLRNPGPIVVHCSAGIGRSGTFIALYYLILCIQKGAFVDVMEVVKATRNCRPGMVQVDEQYQFIYTSLDFYKQTLKTSSQIIAPIKVESEYYNIPFSAG